MISTIYKCVFSPTGTSRKIANAIVDGVDSICSCGVDTIDLTYSLSCNHSFNADELAIFAVPVYGGKVAPEALKRMNGLQGNGTPAVVVVVYGNRDIGNSANELSCFLAERDFVVIAAGAFIGEHSYSTDEFPIAVNRPDATDLDDAKRFGRAIIEKLDSSKNLSPINSKRLKVKDTGILSKIRFIAFALKYIKQQRKNPINYLPECDESLCKHCGACVVKCPVQAIPKGDETHTDPDICIKCCACVKVCPEKARTFASPFAPVLSRNYSRRNNPATLL